MQSELLEISGNEIRLAKLYPKISTCQNSDAAIESLITKVISNAQNHDSFSYVGFYFQKSKLFQTKKKLFNKQFSRKSMTKPLKPS